MAKKPPLLFIHGYRGNHLGLAEIAAELSDYEIHSPDIAPAGTVPFKKYDMPTYTKFIADYISKHHLDHPILVGHSLGSIIAAATAEKYPDLLNEKLILLAPISSKPTKFFANLVPLTTILPTKLIDYLTTRYLFVPHDRTLFKKALATTHACAAVYTSRKDVAAAGKFSASHSIRDFQFQKHTLIVAGEKDRLMPLSKTKALTEDYHAELKIIQGAGHILNYEKPKQTAAAIAEFLKR